LLHSKTLVNLEHLDIVRNNYDIESVVALEKTTTLPNLKTFVAY